MIKIKADTRNTNKHTTKGMELLEFSINNIGVIESISVANDGTIISGHARKEIFDKKGLKPKEIELAENEYPVIVTDIKANSKKYYEAQILANTTANQNFNLDIEEIEVLADEYALDLIDLGIKINEELDAMELFNIEIPFYKPKEQKPLIDDLAETSKYNFLIKKIDKLDVEDGLKNLLKNRASFFIDFNFDKIADFYYKESDAVKEVMKELGMVIIAPKEALNLGFIELKEMITE